MDVEKLSWPERLHLAQSPRTTPTVLLHLQDFITKRSKTHSYGVTSSTNSTTNNNDEKTWAWHRKITRAILANINLPSSVVLTDKNILQHPSILARHRGWSLWILEDPTCIRFASKFIDVLAKHSSARNVDLFLDIANSVVNQKSPAGHASSNVLYKANMAFHEASEHADLSWPQFLRLWRHWCTKEAFPSLFSLLRRVFLDRQPDFAQNVRARFLDGFFASLLQERAADGTLYLDKMQAMILHRNADNKPTFERLLPPSLLCELCRLLHVDPAQVVPHFSSDSATPLISSSIWQQADWQQRRRFLKNPDIHPADLYFLAHDGKRLIWSEVLYHPSLDMDTGLSHIRDHFHRHPVVFAKHPHILSWLQSGVVKTTHLHLWYLRDMSARFDQATASSFLANFPQFLQLRYAPDPASAPTDEIGFMMLRGLLLNRALTDEQRMEVWQLLQPKVLQARRCSYAYELAGGYFSPDLFRRIIDFIHQNHLFGDYAHLLFRNRRINTTLLLYLWQNLVAFLNQSATNPNNIIIKNQTSYHYYSMFYASLAMPNLDQKTVETLLQLWQQNAQLYQTAKEIINKSIWIQKNLEKSLGYQVIL